MNLSQSSMGKTRMVTPHARTRPSRRAWAVTAALVLFMMINFADKAVLGLAAAPIMKELNISASEYGLISSGFFFLFCVAALVLGFVANRVRTKWLLLVMALLWSAAQLPVVLSASFGILFATRVGLGAAEGPAYPIATHALHKWFSDKDRSLPTSLLTVGAPLGVVVASPILAWVIATQGWRAAFLILGLVGIVWSLTWAKVGKEGPGGHGRPERGAELDPAAPSTESEATRGAEEGAAVRVPYLRIFTSGTWLASLFAGFAVYWALTVLTAWVPLYLQKALGYSQTATGSLVVLPWAVYGGAQLAQGLITRRLMGRGVSSRMARGVLGGACVFVAGLAMILLVVAPAGPLQIVLLSIAFGLGAPIFPIAQTLSAEIAPSSQRGAVLGTYAALYSLSAVIAPYLVGIIVQGSPTPVGGYNSAFIVTAVLLLASGAVAAVFIRPQRDRAKIQKLASSRSTG